VDDSILWGVSSKRAVTCTPIRGAEYADQHPAKLWLDGFQHAEVRARLSDLAKDGSTVIYLSRLLQACSGRA